MNPKLWERIERNGGERNRPVANPHKGALDHMRAKRDADIRDRRREELKAAEERHITNCDNPLYGSF